MTKPAAPGARNIYGVRSDAIDCLFSITEATGSALTQLATAREGTGGDGLVFSHSAGTGTPVTTAWASDSNGPYLDLNNGGTAAAVRLWNNTTGADVTIPSGTFMKVFRIGTDGGTAGKTFLRSSTANPNTSIRMTRNASSSDVNLIIENGASDYTYTWASVSETDVLCLIVRWGPRGFYAYLNGVLGTPTNSPSSYTGGILTASGAYWNAGTGANPGLQKLYSFCRWNVQLEDWEIDTLFADFWHPFAKASTKISTPCVPTFDAQDTSVACKLVTVEGMTGSAYVRYRTASTLIGLRTATPSTAWTITTVGKNDDRRVTGLTVATSTIAQFEWSDDGTNYYCFPFGYNLLKTRGYVNATTGYVQEVKMSDDHVNAVGDDGVQVVVGYGRDILYGEDYPPQATGIDGKRKQYYAWQYIQAVCRDYRDSSFITIGGDNFYFDSANANGTSDTNAAMFNCAVTWYKVYGHILRFMPGYMVIGNHERVGQNWIWEQDGTNATSKQAIRYYEIFALKPALANSNVSALLDCGYLPPEGAIPSAFVASTAYAVGDVVKPTGTGTQAKTRAYICTTAGTSGSDDTSGWTRNIGSTVTSGSAVFTCAYRYDSDVASVWTKDADGYYAITNPFFYRFDWGASVRRIMLDAILYQAFRDESSSATTPSQYLMGASQRAFFQAEVADPDKPVLTIVEAHNLFGGESIGPNEGSGYYGRGSGARANDIAYFLAQGYSPGTDEMMMDRYCAHYGVPVFKNHDHTFAHATSYYGVPYFTFSGVATPDKYETSLTYVGWNSPNMNASYGTSQSLGTLYDDGSPATRMVCRYNVLGFSVVEYDTALNKYRVRAIQSGLAWQAVLGSSQAAERILASERFIASANETVDGFDQIDLADSLNASPRPIQIGLIVNSADYTGTWWENTLTTYQEQLGIQAWQDSASYVAGDIVQPTTFAGIMAYTESSGTSAASEPTWGDIGDITTDNDISWFIYPLWSIPYTQFVEESIIAAGVQLNSSAPATVRAEYVPRIVYMTDWLEPTPNGTVALETGKVGSMSIRRRGIGL